jgi:hypothetical protein
MAEPKFQFKTQYTTPGVADVVGEVKISEIEKMTGEEFASLDGRLVNVRRRKRRDMIIFDDDVTIEAGTQKELFRIGVGGEDSTVNVNTAYKKTRYHTNMSRGGDFGDKSVTIVKAVEVYAAAFALQPTTLVAGAPTNPKGAAIANYDPALWAHTLLNWLELSFFRGETAIFDGQLVDFEQEDGISGVVGAAVGGIFQNGTLFGSKPLDNPQVLVDNEDFHIMVEALHQLVNTNAAGIGIPFNVQVKLSTTELRRVY